MKEIERKYLVLLSRKLKDETTSVAEANEAVKILAMLCRKEKSPDECGAVKEICGEYLEFVSARLEREDTYLGEANAAMRLIDTLLPRLM